MQRFLAAISASAAILIASLAAPAASAQQASTDLPLHGHVHDRGVRILQPEQTPAPSAPVAAQSATPIGAAQPAAGIQPASVSHASAAGAQQGAPLPAAVIKACARPMTQPDLQVDASSDFKSRLGPRLVGGTRVVVDLATPYGADEAAPAGLQPWLDAVKATGGQVTVSQYCLASRGFGTWFKTLFSPGPATSTATPRSYRYARRYDVVLHADAFDQKITQVEFVPRAVRSAS